MSLPPPPRLWSTPMQQAAALTARAMRPDKPHAAAYRKATTPLELLDMLIKSPGIPVDGRGYFSFHGREFWRPIYQRILDPMMVIMSSAQVGKTLLDLVGSQLIMWMETWRGQGGWLGMYFPTHEMALTFSQGRLDPIIDAVKGAVDPRRVDTSTFGIDPKTARAIREYERQHAEGFEANRFNFKMVGLWWLFLAWAGSENMQDAFPLSRIIVDEVRLMAPGVIERLRNRIMGAAGSGQRTGIILNSTAGFPGDSLGVQWDLSKQARWHTPCGCTDGIVLADAWPDCLAERINHLGEREHYLRCPVCAAAGRPDEIRDRAAGRWIAHNPAGAHWGYSPNQLHTLLPLDEIARRWATAHLNMADFYNSVLGRYWWDEEGMPFSLARLNANVDLDFDWCKPGDVRGCSMGIDHHLGINFAVISYPDERGRRARAHVECWISDEPFKRAGQLMEEYGVKVCVLERNPNTSEALRFAKDFPGRVWLMDFTSNKKATSGIEKWLEVVQPGLAEAQVNEGIRSPYTVRVNQRLAFNDLAAHYKLKMSAIPDPRNLVQKVMLANGRMVPELICDHIYFDHITRMARRKKDQMRISDESSAPEETGFTDFFWVKLAKSMEREPVNLHKGADPHFAFADLADFIAFTRIVETYQGGGGTPQKLDLIWLT